MSKYDRIEVDTDIAPQKLFNEMKKAEGTYPISEGEDTKQKTFLSLNYLIDDDKYKTFKEKYNISDENLAKTVLIWTLNWI